MTTLDRAEPMVEYRCPKCPARIGLPPTTEAPVCTRCERKMRRVEGDGKKGGEKG